MTSVAAVRHVTYNHGQSQQDSARSLAPMPALPDPAPTRIEQLCAQKGLRMTEQRRVIARVLSRGRPPRRRGAVPPRGSLDPSISLSTVYRTVKLFEGSGSSSATISARAAPAMRNRAGTTIT